MHVRIPAVDIGLYNASTMVLLVGPSNLSASDPIINVESPAKGSYITSVGLL